MSAFQVQELALPADALALFARIRHLAGSFLLYSGQGFAQQPFDLLAACPSERIRLAGPDAPRNAAAAVTQMIQRLQGFEAVTASCPLPGWYGLMAYNLASPAHPAASPRVPALDAGFYPAIIVIDRATQRTSCIWLKGHEAEAQALMAQLQTPPAATAGFQLQGRFSANMDQAGYTRRFERVQHYLHAGDCYQVNLAQRFSAACAGDPWRAYERLTQALPAPMGGYFNGDDYQVLSLSPERFLSIRQGHITTHPIKGTRPRDADPERDRQQAEALRNSEKDRAENLMIVDLLRNDLGLSCQPGSIRVTDLFAIESYRNVHHLVSHIEGRLRPDVHPLQALLAAFPGGSITGAPKKRAMEIIAELEPDSRSFYCGSAFYCDVAGRLDSNILIRSLLCEGDRIHCWGGGGIVVDSTAAAEYQETLDKVGAILGTLERLSGLAPT